VDFKILIAQLPEMPGWERGLPEGERMSSPVSDARGASRSRDDPSIRAKIRGSGVQPAADRADYDDVEHRFLKREHGRVERATTAVGFPAFEKWDNSQKDGELTHLRKQTVDSGTRRSRVAR